MKTADKILLEVREHKTCSRAMLYNYFKKLGIMPLGARQRPQQYPDDAASQILAYLGFEPAGCGRPGCPNGKEMPGAVTARKIVGYRYVFDADAAVKTDIVVTSPEARIVSMRELRAIRRAARKGAAK